MNLKRLSAAAATGVLTVGLALGAPTSANAAVKSKDVPSKADLVKIFPELKDATFAADKSKKIAVPAAKCGANKMVKVKSTYSTAGVNGVNVVSAGVAEFSSTAAAKKYFKKYKAFVKKCKSFKVAGFKVTMKSAKAPKVGQERLALTQVTSGSGVTIHSSSVLIRHGKRIATGAATDDAKIPGAKTTKLAKVIAKKMK